MAKEEMTVEQIAESINKSIDGLKKSIEAKADVSELEEKFSKIAARMDLMVDKEGKLVLPDIVTKQQEQLDEISTQLKQLAEYQKGSAEPVGSQIFKRLKGDDFQKKMKDPGIIRMGGLDFEVKAANIDTDDINSGTIERDVEPGVASAPWRPTPIWDAVNKGIIGQGRDGISWWEETTRTDGAGFLAEGAKHTPTTAKTWTKQTMDIKKVMDATKVSREALEDFEHITSEVNDLLNNGIPRKRETELIEGTGLTVYLKGILEYAKTFALPGNFNKVPSPNEGDVLAAGILQVMNGNTSDANKKGFIPNLLVLNPGDSTNMRLLKNVNETYIHHPLLSPDGSLFQGIRIVTSLDLDAGQFIIGDFSRAKAYIKRNMRISFHYENEDDVLYDLVLVMASMRIAGLKVTTPEAYAFVTGTFEAGKALIEEGVA